MPHYKDGSKAKVGDIVAATHYSGKSLGVVVNIQPSAESCNLQLARIATIHGSGAEKVVIPRSAESDTQTAGDCEKVF